MIERPSVDALMAGGLADWLASQQVVRDATAARSRRISHGTIAGAVVAAILLTLATGIGEMAFMLGLLIAGLGQAWAASVRKPVIESIKQAMNARIAAALDCTFSAQAVAGAEFQLALDHDLLPAHDKVELEDDWRGTIGAMPFSLYEAHLQEWRNSGKNRRLVTVFRGAIIAISFARRFHGVTLIERSGARLTFFGLRDSIEKNGVTLDRIKMVDPRLGDDFAIWGSDPVEARYLVHPAYVERLIELEQRFDGQKIRALFHGGQLIIIIEAKENMFESGSLDAAQDRDRMAATIAQFVALATLATEMNERPRG